MKTGYVKAVLGDAKDHGFRGTINLVGGTKINFDFTLPSESKLLYGYLHY